jgi:hypothetical protein
MGIRRREEHPLKLKINREDEEVANHMKQWNRPQFISEGRSDFSVLFTFEGQPLLVHLAVIL